MEKHDKAFSYIRGVDGLRALAVLAVMLYHVDPILLPGGFSGVDLFFVISGYVVSATLSRDSTSDFFRFVTAFYTRRIIRIVPALIVCLVVVSIVITLFIPNSWLSSTTNKTGLYAFFGLSNFALIWFNDGYFSPRVDFNSFTHTWSLGVEEQFYVIYPLLFFIWMKFKERKDFLGGFVHWLLPTLLVISLIYSYFETPVNPDNAYYLLPSRFWELACGAVLFQLHSRKRFIPGSAIEARLYLLTGMTLVGLGFVLSDEGSFPFPWALLSVGGSIFLISGVLYRSDRKPAIQRFLERSWLVYIGKTSYSLYLWHWPVYVFMRWTSGLNTMVEISAAFAMTFTLANASYHFIEIPCRKNKFTISWPSWRLIATGITAIVFSYLLAGFVFKSQPTISLSVTKDTQTWYPYEWPEEVNNEKPKAFIGRKLFVLGDSHAGAYSTMLQKLSDEFDVKIIKFSAGGCAIADLLRPGKTSSNKCAEEIEKHLSAIESSASPGDIILLASLRMNRLGDQWASFSEEKIFETQSSEKASSDRKLALNETVELIKRFEKLQMHIIIDAPMPVFRSPPFRCSDWYNRSNPVCSSGFTMKRDYLLEYRKPVMDSLRSLSVQFPELLVWDPFPILCKTSICSAYDNGKPLFFDGDHLSAYGNRVLYPSFLSVIKKIWMSG